MSEPTPPPDYTAISRELKEDYTAYYKKYTEDSPAKSRQSIMDRLF